jgi:hypothetical protein
LVKVFGLGATEEEAVDHLLTRLTHKDVLIYRQTPDGQNQPVVLPAFETIT